VPADGSYKQASDQIAATTGGSRLLTPETSNSLNVSLAWSPEALKSRPWIDSLDVELTYWDVEVKRAIGAPDAQLQLDRCVADNDDTACVGIERIPEGTLLAIGNRLQNLGGIETRGLDLTLTYESPTTASGRFRATSQSSYLIDYSQKDPSQGGFKTSELEGTVSGTPERAFPKLKSSLVIEWFYKRFMVGLTSRYIDKVREDCRDLADFPGTCSDFEEDDSLSTNVLGRTVYNDVQVNWSPASEPGLSLTAGVNNLFNQDPPACYSCSLNGFNGTTYDVPGVFGYVSASYQLK
jgi:iron complex outermembrane recepter protein